MYIHGFELQLCGSKAKNVSKFWQTGNQCRKILPLKVQSRKICLGSILYGILAKKKMVLLTCVFCMQALFRSFIR